MSRELDLEELDRIPDPFGEAAGAARADERAGAPPPQGPLSPTRGDVRRRRVLAAVAALLFEVVYVALIERRPDLRSMPLWAIALGLVIPLAAAGLALVAANGKGRLGLGAPILWLVSLCALAPVFFAGVTLATAPPDERGQFWVLAVRCMGVTAALTAPPLALAALAFRRAFVAAWGWRTAALGIACGALGAATMSLVCPHTGGFHVVVGHGAMMLVGGVVGGMLGRRVTRA